MKLCLYQKTLLHVILFCFIVICSKSAMIIDMHITNNSINKKAKIVIANAISNKQPLCNLVNDDHLGFFHNNDYKLLVGYTDGVR